MKKFLKNTLVFAILTMATNFTVQAAITCQTPRGTKVFQVHDSKVTFMVEGFNQRIPASINNVRTKRSLTGFTKIVSFEGHKHTIHIENTSNFSELNDYITIRSRKGHEMTYPISCKN